MEGEAIRLARCMAALIRRTPELRALSGVWQPVLRLLAAGRPVSMEDVAAEAELSAERVRDALERASNAMWDEFGRLIGLGVTLRPTACRLRLPGQVLYASSALDPLMLGAVQPRPVQVNAPCRVSGIRIRIYLTSATRVHVEPSTAVMSVLRCPEEHDVFPPAAHVRHLFFRSTAVAGPWLVEFPEYRVLPVRDAFAFARRLADLW